MASIVTFLNGHLLARNLHLVSTLNEGGEAAQAHAHWWFLAHITQGCYSNRMHVCVHVALHTCTAQSI